MADRMAEDGFKEVGYEYVMIDDCWSEMERDKLTGRLVPDRKRFPNGIKGNHQMTAFSLGHTEYLISFVKIGLADYVHSKGLKLGLYGDMGTLTCGGYPVLWNGSTSLFDIDAQSLAEWGVDSFKVDGCYMADKTLDFDWMFPMFGEALKKVNTNAESRVAISIFLGWSGYTVLLRVAIVSNTRRPPTKLHINREAL